MFPTSSLSHTWSALVRKWVSERCEIDIERISRKKTLIDLIMIASNWIPWNVPRIRNHILLDFRPFCMMLSFIIIMSSTNLCIPLTTQRWWVGLTNLLISLYLAVSSLVLLEVMVVLEEFSLDSQIISFLYTFEEIEGWINLKFKIEIIWFFSKI